MPKDLSVIVANRPGAFDALRGATARAGMQIEGVCAVASMGQSIFHLLVEDDDVRTLRATIEDAGLEIRLEREVLIIDIPGGPRAIGQLAARMAQAEVNVDLLYLATGDRLVLGVDSIDRAQKALLDFKG